MDLKKEIKRHVNKYGLKNFELLGIHNTGKALHVICALGPRRIGWWPNSRRKTVHIALPNGRNFSITNVTSPEKFISQLKDYADDI